MISPPAPLRESWRALAGMLALGERSGSEVSDADRRTGSRLQVVAVRAITAAAVAAGVDGQLRMNRI